jgi:hypothetical protein
MDAEDALITTLNAKAEYPEAPIMYIRREIVGRRPPPSSRARQGYALMDNPRRQALLTVPDVVGFSNLSATRWNCHDGRHRNNRSLRFR